MSSCLTVFANIGLFHFSFSITILVPLLFTPPPPLIPIYHQPSRIENVFIICFLHFLVDLVLYLVLNHVARMSNDSFILESRGHAILLRCGCTIKIHSITI